MYSFKNNKFKGVRYENTSYFEKCVADTIINTKYYT